MKQPKISIIIPVKEINDYIRESIPHILSLDYQDFEILILPDEPSEEKIEKTKIIPTGKIGPSEKRDFALKYAQGEILAFLDDDAYPKKDWLKKAVKHFEDDKVAAVGGPALTPKNDSFGQKLSGAVYESFLGGGGARIRYLKVGKEKEIDDWPSVNFLIKKDIFKKIGGFDCSFWPGEDTKLALDIIKLNKKIIYDPAAIVYHHRRPLLYPHLKQVYSYGLHRGYFVKKFPETSFRLPYFIPSLFLLYLILGFFIFKFLPWFFSFYLIPLFIYCLGLLIDGFLTSFRYLNFWLGILVAPMIFLTHLTYGLGFLRGLLTQELKK